MKHMVKRSLNVTIGLVSVVPLLPLMSLIALAIKLESPGPVFYLQKRQKTDGGTFRMLKFRCFAGGGAEPIHPTVVGRFLRQCRLDELPMLLNVVRGDVSLSDWLGVPSLVPPSWLTAIPGPPERYQRAVWTVLLSLLVVLFGLAVLLTR